MANADNGLGPWADADLAQTARTNASIGADDGLPLIVRFISNVAKLIRRRVVQPNAKRDPTRPAIFILQPNPPQLEHAAPKHVPMLDNAQTPVNGRIWFVSAVVASGRYIDFEATDDDSMFTLITDDIEQGAAPTIIFDPRPPVPEARFYPQGLNHPENYKLVALSSKDVTLDEVVATIETVYKSCLVTPDAQPDHGKLWHNKDKWWPSSKAEAFIQLYIKAGLAGAFPTCTIRHEQPMPEGRLDLEIEETDSLDRSVVTRHAIIELKILRSFRESGTIVKPKETCEWIESGVNQAFAYRDSKGAKWSALCCFDMRKRNTGEECFKHVRDLANELNVHLKRWFLYAKSTHYRDALASSV